MYNEKYFESDEYAELMDEVIDEHEDLYFIHTADVRINVLASTEKKRSKKRVTYGECIKVPDIYKLYCPYDFLIVIYDENCEGMAREQLKVLLYHELLHVNVDEKNGEPIYDINPHDIEDFRAVIDKYGIDWAK